jgi:hypothetical protein
MPQNAADSSLRPPITSFTSARATYCSTIFSDANSASEISRLLRPSPARRDDLQLARGERLDPAQGTSLRSGLSEDRLISSRQLICHFPEDWATNLTGSSAQPLAIPSRRNLVLTGQEAVEILGRACAMGRLRDGQNRTSRRRASRLLSSSECRQARDRIGDVWIAGGRRRRRTAPPRLRSPGRRDLLLCSASDYVQWWRRDRRFAC